MAMLFPIRVEITIAAAITIMITVASIQLNMVRLVARLFPSVTFTFKRFSSFV
ncbi:hypothetical protein IMSAGC009_02353 [Lachnospiraceae bacterium]|nr:hypothetical protein IMSAGC009_02353 [Lachnospiraceae bacterium]